MLRSIWTAWRRRRLYRRCVSGPVRAVVLRYHSVGEPGAVAGYLDPGLSVPPQRFAEHLGILGRRFTFRTMDELEAVLAGDGGPSAFVTFDDGYRDNREVALPLLERAGARATFYVTTGPLRTRSGLWISELARLVPRLRPGALSVAGRTLRVAEDRGARTPLRRELTRVLAGLPRPERERALDRLAEAAGVARGEGLAGSFMTPDDVLALRRAGMLVGAHTRSHPHLALLSAEHHEDEVSGSRRDLEEILGEPVEHFAYPNPGGGGAVPDAAREAVRRAGFRTAVTSNPGPLEPGIDLLRIPRLGVYEGAQQAVLFSVLEDAATR